MEAHDAFVAIARIGGLVLLIGGFVAAIAYTYWPSRRRHLERGSRLPLAEGQNLRADRRATTDEGETG